MRNVGTWWTRLKGRLERPLADAAGDRRAEAKAEARMVTGHEPDDITVDVEEQEVRTRHGDIEAR
jgi:hypothetical protein